MKSKTKLIEIPLFKNSVLVVTGTKKHLRKALKEYGAEEVWGLFEGVEYAGRTAYKADGDRTVVVHIDTETADEAERPAVTAHEMLHASSYILNAIGVPFTDDTEEVYCYLLGYLIEETTKS